MTKEEIDLEKLRIKRNREKFWVGTVVIGIISLLLNSSIQNSKIEYERVRQENEHLSKFVSYAVDKDLEIRRDIAEYFATISYTKETRNRWENYLASIDTLVDLKYSLMADIEINKDDKDKLFMQLSEAKLALLNDPLNESLKGRISNLYKELQGKETMIIEKSVELQKISDTWSEPSILPKPSWYSIAEIELEKNITEIPGVDHNPEILKYWDGMGLNISTDEVPWTSAFVNWCFDQVDIEGSGKGNARSWLTWGVPLAKPRIGCVVVMWTRSKQSWTGAVGLYAGDDGNNVLVLEGNAKNSIKITSRSKEKILGYRWPN